MLDILTAAPGVFVAWLWSFSAAGVSFEWVTIGEPSWVTCDGSPPGELTEGPFALLASVQAREAAVRGARADYWPRLAVQSSGGANVGELSIEGSPYQSVSDWQYYVGLHFEWELFEGFERRNKLKLEESRQREAEDELEHAQEKAIRQVWKAYNDSKVALAKQRAAAALLAASEKAWAATIESYQHGLATDVREAQRGLAQARALEQAARAEAWTRAAAFAVSTGDLAQP